MSNKTEKGYISHPPTQAQQERIRAACATTRQESADCENLLASLGYAFRTVNAAGNSHQTVAQVKSTRRDWRPVAAAWGAIKQQLRNHGVNTNDPAIMFQFENAVERLCWENRLDIEDLSAGRYQFYWEVAT
jgi:hypothetical protein